MDNIFLGNSARLFLPFISLIVGIVTLILCFDCIWRADKRLKKFIMFVAAAIIVHIIRKIFLILGYNNDPSWYFFAQYVDIGIIGFLFLAMMQMYRMIRVIDHERK